MKQQIDCDCNCHKDGSTIEKQSQCGCVIDWYLAAQIMSNNELRKWRTKESNHLVHFIIDRELR